MGMANGKRCCLAADFAKNPARRGAQSCRCCSDTQQMAVIVVVVLSVTNCIAIQMHFS